MSVLVYLIVFGEDSASCILPGLEFSAAPLLMIHELTWLCTLFIMISFKYSSIIFRKSDAGVTAQVLLIVTIYCAS